MPPTAQSLWAHWERLRAGHVRILWLVLGALLMVSVLPLALYHRLVLQLSQDKLVDTERVQQTDLVRSLALEIQHFEFNLTQQLLSERQILSLTGLIDNVEDPAAEPKVTHLLENFVESNLNTFLYLTAVGKSGRGQKHRREISRPNKIPSWQRPCSARLSPACNRNSFRSPSFAVIRWRWCLITGRRLSWPFR